MKAVILKVLSPTTWSVVKATICAVPKEANWLVLMARMLVLVSTATSRVSRAATCAVPKELMLRVLKEVT